MTTKTSPVMGTETTKELTTWKKKTSEITSYAGGLAVETDGDYLKALEQGKSIKRFLESVETRREEITKPLNDALKSTRALFKPLETQLGDALAVIRSKMTTFQREKAEAARIEEEKIAARVEKGTMKPQTAMAKMADIDRPEKTVESGAAKATMRTVLKYRVVDKSKIPLQFMEPDMVKIKASFRAGTPVEGVESYEEQELAIS